MARSLGLLVLLSACSTTRPDGSHEPDPWEPVNRKIFWFNEKLDTYVLEPVATGWDTIAPDAVESSVQNAFQNLGYPISLVGNLAQGKGKAAWTETLRFVINSTVGVAGLFDPAEAVGLEPRREDIGQALGAWGVSSGPYVVLPFIGPSSVRDTGGLVVEWPLDLVSRLPEPILFSIARTINWRAINLELIDDSRAQAFDWYVFVRNAYLENRESLVLDGEAPAVGGEGDGGEAEGEDDLYNTGEDDLYDLDFEDDPEEEGGPR